MLVGLEIINKDGIDTGVVVFNTDDMKTYTYKINVIENLQNMIMDGEKIVVTKGNRDRYINNKKYKTIVGYYNRLDNREVVYVVSDSNGVLDIIEDKEVKEEELTNYTGETDGYLNLNKGEVKCEIVSSELLCGAYNKITVYGDELVIDGKELDISDIIFIRLYGGIYSYRVRQVTIKNIGTIKGLFDEDNVSVTDIKIQSDVLSIEDMLMYIKNLKRLTIGNRNKAINIGELKIDRYRNSLEHIDIEGIVTIHNIIIQRDDFDFSNLYSDERVIVRNIYTKGNRRVKDVVVHKGYTRLNIIELLTNTVVENIKLKGMTKIEEAYTVRIGERNEIGDVTVECNYDYPYKELEEMNKVKNIIRREPTGRDKEIEESGKLNKIKLLYNNSNTYKVTRDTGIIKNVFNSMDKNKLEDALNIIADNLGIMGREGKIYTGELGNYFYILTDVEYKGTMIYKNVKLRNYRVIHLKHYSVNKATRNEIEYLVLIMPTKYESLKDVINFEHGCALVHVERIKVEKDSVVTINESVDGAVYINVDGKNYTVR